MLLLPYMHVEESFYLLKIQLLIQYGKYVNKSPKKFGFAVRKESTVLSWGLSNYSHCIYCQR